MIATPESRKSVVHFPAGIAQIGSVHTENNMARRIAKPEGK